VATGSYPVKGKCLKLVLKLLHTLALGHAGINYIAYIHDQSLVTI